MGEFGKPYLSAQGQAHRQLPTPPPAAFPVFSSARRVFAVWRRHQRVYFKFVVANSLPPLLDPLMFILAVGIGLGAYVGLIGNESYITFIVPGMISHSLVWSSSFETTYGTFLRMEYEKIYDGMLASPVSLFEMLLGEVLWVATKAAMFSAGVCLVVSLCGLVDSWWALLCLPLGILGGMLFALMGITVTSQVREINNYNFYLTGIVTPMYFYSGALFPLDHLPQWLRAVCNVLPLTQLVTLMRGAVNGNFSSQCWRSLLILMIYLALLWPLAVRLMRRRILV